MSRSPIELWLALATVALATLAYAGLSRNGPPAPGSAVGLMLGTLGLLLMLATQTLYSLRKRWTGFNLLPMSAWLKAHIFTGIVGPYLAFLHAAWKFNGLAGALMLVTAIVVLSGLMGRYVYTAVPRSLDETVAEAFEVERRLEAGEEGLEARRDALLAELDRWAAARRWLAWWHLFHVPMSGVLFVLAFFHVAGALYYSTFSR